jgi:hypothetical protein
VAGTQSIGSFASFSLVPFRTYDSMHWVQTVEEAQTRQLDEQGERFLLNEIIIPI